MSNFFNVNLLKKGFNLMCEFKIMCEINSEWKDNLGDIEDPLKYP